MAPEWSRSDGQGNRSRRVKVSSISSRSSSRRVRAGGGRRHRASGRNRAVGAAWLAAADAIRRRRLERRRAGTRILMIRSAIAIALIAGVAATIARTNDEATPAQVRFTVGTAAADSGSGAVAEAGRSLLQRGATSVSRSRLATVPPAPTTTVTVTATPAQQSPATPAPCHISYSVVPKSKVQFTVVLVIANTSSTTVNGWTLRWDFPPTQKIVYGWNAMVSNSASGAVATDIGFDQVIQPGASVTLGFVGKWQGWVPTPTGFTLNGQSCQWEPTAVPPTLQPTETTPVVPTGTGSPTPSASQSPTPSASGGTGSEEG